MKKRIDARVFRDPVCGMEVIRITAVTEAEHIGKTYYFCALGCKHEFLKTPDRYLRQHRQHGVTRDHIKS